MDPLKLQWFNLLRVFSQKLPFLCVYLENGPLFRHCIQQQNLVGSEQRLQSMAIHVYQETPTPFPRQGEGSNLLLLFWHPSSQMWGICILKPHRRTSFRLQTSTFYRKVLRCCLQFRFVQRYYLDPIQFIEKSKNHHTVQLLKSSNTIVPPLKDVSVAPKMSKSRASQRGHNLGPIHLQQGKFNLPS